MAGARDGSGELHPEKEAAGSRSRPFLQRVPFRDIESDRFVWRSDRSCDAAETWIVDLGCGVNLRSGARWGHRGGPRRGPREDAGALAGALDSPGEP